LPTCFPLSPTACAAGVCDQTGSSALRGGVGAGCKRLTATVPSQMKEAASAACTSGKVGAERPRPTIPGPRHCSR
jgi:hypothetical protein